MDQPQLELLLLLAVPLIGAVIAAWLGPERKSDVRWVSCIASVLTLGLAISLSVRFMHVQSQWTEAEARDRAHPKLPTFRPEFVPGSPGVRGPAEGGTENPHATSWNILRIGPGVIQFYVGVDGLNIWLVLLTAVLMLPSVLISWNHVDERVNEFFAWLLILQTAMMGIFLAFDIILFYVFFELSLVPLFFLIGIWGGPERRHAARKFFLYTLVGSLITLLGVLGVVLACYDRTGELTFAIPRLVEIVHKQLDDPSVRAYWSGVQFWVFLALMAGFAVKVPLVPFHTWLPLAHVEAPTAGSVDLAGVLLKVGAYGFLRLCVPLTPDVSLGFGLPLVTTLATIGIVYGALCAYAQDDVKKMIAYSSVSHLGLCMLGMFSLTVAGLAGSLLQMINHGLSTAGLFLLIGMLYERYHTRKMSDYSGMAGRLPLLGAFMVFICLTSVGLPGLNGFVGELLALAGIFEHEVAQGLWPTRAFIASTGVLLGAWYLFTMLRRVFFGPVKEPHTDGHAPVSDLSARELVTLVPIAALCVALGLFPKTFLKTAEPDLQIVAGIARKAEARARAEGEAGLAPAASLASNEREGGRR
jgi:NADH-quinone oxidoreductase subunit M